MTGWGKEVRFDEYCKKCKHWEKEENEDPCYICLEDGWGESEKPVKFEEAETK